MDPSAPEVLLFTAGFVLAVGAPFVLLVWIVNKIIR